MVFLKAGASYKVVKRSKYIENIVLHFKTGEVFKTDTIIVNAGKTKDYWFFYNRSNNTTKVIKTENIDLIEFK